MRSLINAISNRIDADEEDQLVVTLAKKYIETFLTTMIGKKQKYLRKRRLKIKAELASAIAITHPDRAGIFRGLLTSHPWEEYEQVKAHFKMFNELL